MLTSVTNKEKMQETVGKLQGGKEGEINNE